MSDMKCLVKKVKSFTVVLLVAVCIALSIVPFDINASGNAKITSMDDFYVKLSNQIHNHEIDVMYDVPDYNLVKSIMSITMEDYQYHYDEDNPLISGCYLSYYIDYLNLYYVNGTIRIVIQFKYSKTDMDYHFSMMKELASELKCDTDYDTVQNVHDYLIKNFEYDKKTVFVNHTDIDGFKDKQMVCSGYSLAAYYLLNEAGVPTRVITGYGGSGRPDTANHMWNMVFLDENWYNMDITWDDTNGNMPTYKYFLKNDKDFTNHLRLGKYDIDFFNYSVAEKSYKLPMKFKFGDFKIYIIFAVVIFIVMNYLSKIINSRHKKQIQPPYGNVSGNYNGFDLNNIEELDNDKFTNPNVSDESRSSQLFNDDEIPRL